MNYSQAYNFLLSINGLARKEYLHDPKHCEIYLKRLEYFLKLLGEPQKKIPHYIHITGTSGKGSVAIMLAAILRANNKKVALLTSPNPSTITERWEINGREMSKVEFTKIVSKKIQPAWKKYLATSPYDPISFYEMMTAVGLCYFADKKVDWAVIEVGCGGRYDSTNVIPRKEAAIITNVGLDHLDLLGDSKQKIAYEKSGIIKPRAMTFTAENNIHVLKIIKQECKKQKTELIKVNTKQYKIISSDVSGTDFIYEDQTYHLNVLGAHQVKNAILCIQVAKYLGITESAISAGLKKAELPLRMEIVSKKPLIILDGAHNHDKMKTTVDTVKQLLKNSKTKNKLHIMVGFSDNKDIRDMIKQLTTLKPTSVACTRFTSNVFRKTTNPQTIARLFKRYGTKTKTKLFLDSNETLKWSKKQADKNDIILITGSIFLSGEIRPKLTKTKISDKMR